MDKSKAGWLYLSGAFSFVISASLFFGLIAYMVYRAPTIKISDIFDDNFEISEALLKSLRASAIDVTVAPMADEEDHSIGAPKAAAQSVKDLFGESNATLDPSELLLPARQNTPARAAIPEAEEKEDRQGRDSRVESVELTRFKAIDSAQAPAQNAAERKEIENRYYAILYRMLYAEWRTVPSDLGKIAWIEMRIDRGGAISYRVTSAPSDQYFVDRLEQALSRVQAAKIEAPPKALTINVKFQVKEQ